MKKLNRRDKKFRQFFFKYEFFGLYNRFLFRHVLSNVTLSLVLKKKLLLLFYYRKNKRFYKSTIVRRCLLTGRGRGIFRNFNITRHFLREFLSFGFLLGYKKAVW